MNNKRIGLAMFVMAATINNLIGQAAAPAPKAAATGGLYDILFWIFGIACLLVFLIAMLFILKTNQLLYKKLIELEAAKNGVILPQAAVATESTSLLTNLRKKYWSDAVPIEREEEIAFHHSYDGIRELDNRLPPWWVNMFVLTIFWAVGYMWYYHFGGNGPSSTETYEADVAAARKAAAVTLESKANAIDESSVTALSDAGALEDGARIFKTLCAACHGQNGEGTVGPNFTDEYWIHGGGIKNVFKTVKYGVPEKGMISWQAQLKPLEIQKVASYILTLKGTNPPNPKAPQGEIWKETAQN